MFALLHVMQMGCLHYYVIITHYYIIITQTSVITHYYSPAFQSPELADARVPPIGLELATNGIQIYAIAK